MSLRHLTLAVLLAWTSGASAQDSAKNSTENTDDVAMFREVLAQHQALNARVERVGHRLLTANAHLCPEPRRTLGMSVHTVSDYPRSLRPLARDLLGVSEGVSVRSVVEDGPADMAGVEAGDRVAGLGGMPINDGVTAPRYWEMAQARMSDATDVDLIVVRGGERLSLSVATQAACDYRPVVEFSPRPNAYADGEALVITSEFVRRTDTDARLALILGHELAHSIAHGDVIKGRQDTNHDLELDADAKGLVMTANAGFDMELAVDGMEDFARAYYIADTPTHPAHTQRVEMLRALTVELEAKLEDGDTLDLDDGDLADRDLADRVSPD